MERIWNELFGAGEQSVGLILLDAPSFAESSAGSLSRPHRLPKFVRLAGGTNPIASKNTFAYTKV
jgi:hypothetical protein